MAKGTDLHDTMHNLYHCATCGERVVGYAEVEDGKIYHSGCHPLARWKDDKEAIDAFEMAAELGRLCTGSTRRIGRLKIELVKATTLGGEVITGAWVPIMLYVKACEVMR